MSTFDFLWQQQLRYYYEDEVAAHENPCQIKQIQSDLAFDIKDKILKKAAYLVKTDKEKIKSKKIKSVISNERN